MAIRGDDKVRTRCNGAVGKGIIIGIARDRVKTGVRPDAANSPVQQVDQCQEAPPIRPAFAA